MTDAKTIATGNLPAGVPGAPVAETSSQPALRDFVRHSLLFVLVGLVLYLALYAAADQLIYQYGKRNRFFNVKTAPSAVYDYVIVGASHAAVFDYADMNARLEQMTGTRILNLSIVGSGPVVSRLLLDYFLAGHRTKNVLYVIDSFAFNSAEWNEKRFEDVRLFDRAPFDPTLVQVMLQKPATRSAGWDYLVGFTRINNADRFKPDVTDDESQRFAKTVYHAVPQIDKQRLDYLYPKNRDPQVLEHYLGEFEALVKDLEQRGIGLLVLKPPIPARIYKLLPDEEKFDQALKDILERHQVKFYDYSLVSNDDKYYFNPDHLNQAGVLNFYENQLQQVLVEGVLAH